MGNQQFTASGLLFYNCQTGLQISWDWGWTLQNINVVNAQTGVIIVGGAGGVCFQLLTHYHPHQLCIRTLLFVAPLTRTSPSAQDKASDRWPSRTW